MKGVEVQPVSGRKDLEAFVALPYSLHKEDPFWTPLLRRDIRALLSRKTNPFFEHGDVECFLARRQSKVVGRIAAIHNRLHNEFHGDRVGFFGLFESVNDLDCASSLFETASAWSKARGLITLRGPASLSMNDECGLLVDGFDQPGVFMMPHNPRCYPSLLETSGFRPVKDLLAYQTTNDSLPERLLEATSVVERRYGIRTRSVDMGRYDAEVDLLKTLYNAAWERNWGFVPMTDKEIRYLAKQLRPVVVPELVVFGEHRGEPIGVAVAVPDFNVAFRANPSGRFFPGILKIIWAARRLTRIRVLVLGTLPAWRGKGVDALLYRRIWESGLKKGYRWAEASWILADNHPMRNALHRMGFEAYKTYRMYERPVG